MVSQVIFLALCIIGINFMVYVFFQWTYGDKPRVITSKWAAFRRGSRAELSRPFLVVGGQTTPIATLRWLQSAPRARQERKGPLPNQRPSLSRHLAELLRK